MRQRKIILGLYLAGIMVLSLASRSVADTIYLRSGKKISGKIVERNENSTKLDISGVTITYYADEIDHIDATTAQPKVSPQPLTPEKKSPAGEISVPRAVQPVTPKATTPAATKPVLETPPAAAATPAPSAPLVAPAESEVKPTVTPFSTPLVQGTKKELILKIIDAMGTKSSLQTMFDKLISEAKPQDVEQLKKALKIDEVIERLVPVYDKHFSEEELQVLLSFYQSPVGKKLVRVTPQLMEDSMKANVEYFQKALPQTTP